jgi:hypothetical protein
MQMRIITRAIAAAAATIAVGGVGAALAPAAYADSVDKSEVANQISNQLSQQVGHNPASVSCPRDLVATMGATLRCNATDAGQTYGVTVTVTNVDAAGNVGFDFKVDSQPS